MRLLCVLSIGVVALAGDASAQPPLPGGGLGSRPPTYSPYLNLLRGGSTTLNYYGLVRPEMQFRQGLQNLSANVAANAQDIGTLETGLGVVAPTGHPTMFMNHGQYFLNSAAGLNALPRYGTGNLNFNTPRQPTLPGGGGAMPTPRR